MELKKDTHYSLIFNNQSKIFFVISIFCFYVIFIHCNDLLSSGALELMKRSQSVQRDLPRPVDMNTAVLRHQGHGDPPLSELQKVSKIFRYIQLIKRGLRFFF